MDRAPLPKPVRFRVYRYGGREAGLTIVGAREAYEQLVLRLDDALKAKAEAPASWGASLFACEADGLESETAPFLLSFELEGESSKNYKSSRPLFGTWWAAALAAIGACALIYSFVRLWL